MTLVIKSVRVIVIVVRIPSAKHLTTAMAMGTTVPSSTKLKRRLVELIKQDVEGGMDGIFMRLKVILNFIFFLAQLITEFRTKQAKMQGNRLRLGLSMERLPMPTRS